MEDSFFQGLGVGLDWAGVCFRMIQVVHLCALY